MNMYSYFRVAQMRREREKLREIQREKETKREREKQRKRKKERAKGTFCKCFLPRISLFNSKTRLQQWSHE